MPDIQWNTLSPLDQLAAIKTSTPQAQRAPAPQMGGGGDSGGLLGGLGDLLSGLSKAFRQNPVSVANQALTQQMQATPPAALASAIMGGGTGTGKGNILEVSSPGQIPRGHSWNQALIQPNQMVKGDPVIPSMPQSRIPQSTMPQSSNPIPSRQPQSTLPPQLTGNSLEQSQGLLRKFEGFQSKPTWDVNAYRTGYGSDTITRADGSIAKVTPNMNVSKEDAERDLARRTQEFQNTAARQVGDGWGKLPANAQASLTSVAYNYGSLPKNIVHAAMTGDPQQIANAIQSHANDNKGVNHSRRMQEAQYALNGNPAQGRDAIEQHNKIQTIEQAHSTPTPDIKSGTPISPETEKSPAFQQAIHSYATARGVGLTQSPYVVNVDFSKPATDKRLQVINAETGKVVYESEVAQGSGKGFGNTPGGHQSSLGTFQATQEYNGKHGQSLKVQGIDKGVNDNAEARDVVVHGADYIGNGKTGHSFGCFAVPTANAPKLINLIKNGTIIHAYGGEQGNTSLAGGNAATQAMRDVTGMLPSQAPQTTIADSGTSGIRN